MAEIITLRNRPPGLFHGLLTRRMLADGLGVSARTIMRYERQGLPVIRRGYMRFYDPVKVNAWLAGNFPSPRSAT